ncbi:HIRAN domain-containing protein [Neotabrizicola sp. sgz301269]|uniref:HIRAN domain-containing protein n=1 Tax=Neotabrizicola sp. sgz301269 TaxID=3276282 RepID=UPI00376F73BA
MKLEGEGDFEFEIVGESHYQDALEVIAGRKEEEGKWLECEATLRAEPDNPYDKNAVAVFIRQKKVGYLSRADALAWKIALERRGYVGQDVTCDAVIVGGWKNKSGDEGHYGVKLDL